LTIGHRLIRTFTREICPADSCKIGWTSRPGSEVFSDASRGDMTPICVIVAGLEQQPGRVFNQTSIPAGASPEQAEPVNDDEQPAPMSGLPAHGRGAYPSTLQAKIADWLATVSILYNKWQELLLITIILFVTPREKVRTPSGGRNL
jgi:hypothetical protein